jgi:hypothetical protein
MAEPEPEFTPAGELALPSCTQACSTPPKTCDELFQVFLSKTGCASSCNPEDRDRVRDVAGCPTTRPPTTLLGVAECLAGQTRTCCGDQTCDGPETPQNCPQDCSSITTADPTATHPPLKTKAPSGPNTIGTGPPCTEMDYRSLNAPTSRGSTSQDLSASCVSSILGCNRISSPTEKVRRGAAGIAAHTRSGLRVRKMSPCFAGSMHEIIVPRQHPNRTTRI